LCEHKKLVTAISRTEFTDVCSALDTNGLVVFSKGHDDRTRKVTLLVQEEDVKYALNDAGFIKMMMDSGFSEQFSF
jgi:Cdc6-like AAA superfamily ATPase